MGNKAHYLHVWVVVALTLGNLTGCGLNQLSASAIVAPAKNISAAAPVVSPIVDTRNSAQAWLQSLSERSASSANGTDAGSNNNHDVRLMRVDLSTADSVFVSMNSNNVSNDNTNASANVGKDTKSDPTLAWDTQTHMDSRGMGMLIPAPTQPTTPTPLELMDANPNQIKYLGAMRSGDESYGLVQVGARVYRVQPHDAIGAGKWPIIHIDSERMQLKVNAKVRVYDKQ